MVLEKIHTIPGLSKMNLWVMFGGINALCYGLSYLMPEKDYVYYFGNKGNGRYSDVIRSQFGCNNTMNSYTAPFMIGAGAML